MASAQEMVDLIEAAILKNVGVKQVTSDGQTVQFESMAEKLAALEKYKRLAAAERKPRRIFRDIRFQ